MAETHTIKSMMEETRKFDPPKSVSEKAWVKNFAEY